MLHLSDADSGRGAEPFNSLFEMPPHVGAVPLNKLDALSILYLRCSPHRVAVRVPALEAFNSLFEMRVREEGRARAASGDDFQFSI